MKAQIEFHITATIKEVKVRNGKFTGRQYVVESKSWDMANPEMSVREMENRFYRAGVLYPITTPIKRALIILKERWGGKHGIKRKAY